MSLSKPFDKCFILKLSWFAFQLAIVPAYSSSANTSEMFSIDCICSSANYNSFNREAKLGNDKFSPAVVSDDAEIWSAGDGMLGEQVSLINPSKIFNSETNSTRTNDKQTKYYPRQTNNPRLVQRPNLLPKQLQREIN
ncbi:hypothetical protein MTR_0019s0180 [Medicago truncatula]|uniref:Transmembrane protein n=1 Tax=Medicago truncatula TaxID=3880 RepID=A0A072TV34_MEDTR|nr:hypothetical protein MTR_0019s0180 [Medicago truncatula]